jgi:hypothetical protein
MATNRARLPGICHGQYGFEVSANRKTVHAQPLRDTGLNAPVRENPLHLKSQLRQLKGELDSTPPPNRSAAFTFSRWFI